MLRLLRIGVKSYSRQLEPQKKIKAVQKQKTVMSQAIEKQRINKIYLQFQATPTDPLSIIQQRFIRKKRLLSNRRIYIPNKRQYMLQLDSYLKQIQKRHENQIVRENYAVPRTIGEKIALELEHEKTKIMFNLLREDKWVIRVSAALFVVFALFEYFTCELPQ